MLHLFSITYDEPFMVVKNIQGGTIIFLDHYR
jgi:hypothetical protein